METNPRSLPKNFKPDLVMKGNQGEQIVAHMLRKDGYFVTCLSDIKGGAPGMTNEDNYLTLPDLQAAANGLLGYCEVKWKSKATFTRITQRNEHGVDKRNWDHYESVAKETGLPVFLFIYERRTGAVLFSPIEFLRKVLRYSPKMGKGGMCFFPRASFLLWGHAICLDGELYRQMSFFEKIGGEGDKLFGVVKTHKGKL